jgi:uncharacterized cupin superfamily protein
VNLHIQVRQPSAEELKSLGVFNWPTWACDVSTFEWTYSEQETCYVLAGQVTVETGGQSVSFGRGDLVVFPVGLSCVWKVTQPVRKHYRFG